MSTGSGVGLIVLGAVLYWAVDVNLPYVDTKTLGSILMAVGAVALVVALAVHLHRSPTGPGAGVALLTAGAVCRWGLDVRPSFVDLDGLGLVLMFCGIVALAATITMEVQRSRSRRVVEYRSPQSQPRRYPG